MSTPTFDLGTIMTNILDAIGNILSGVAQAIANNASVIASVLVLGGLAFALWRYGGRMLREVTSVFRGLF